MLVVTLSLSKGDERNVEKDLFASFSFSWHRLLRRTLHRCVILLSNCIAHFIVLKYL